MRIDVQHSQHDIDDELDMLHARLHQPGHRLHGLPAVALGDSGLIVRHREADGEYFLYIEDPSARQLAGYTIFNRLPELPRRADRYLRAPHTRLRGSAQRKGLATTLYRWALDAGLCLISGARQSVGAASSTSKAARCVISAKPSRTTCTARYIRAGCCSATGGRSVNWRGQRG